MSTRVPAGEPRQDRRRTELDGEVREIKSLASRLLGALSAASARCNRGSMSASKHARCLRESRDPHPLALPLLVGVLTMSAALAGCGGGSSHQTPSATRVTVPAYAGFPATTETVKQATHGASPTCRIEAQGIALDAARFLAHSGPQAPPPADLYYILLRNSLVDFQGRGCDPVYLRQALMHRLNARQRATLLSDLPNTIAATLTNALHSG